MIKKAVCTILYCAFLSMIFSQSEDFNTIGFFSAVSNSKETNTIILIQDLYYSHVSILDKYTVFDYRNAPYSASLPESIVKPSVAFFVNILESPGSWKCELNAVVYPELHVYKQEYEYDSYYQILLDAKNVISAFFASLNSSSPELTADENLSADKKEVIIHLDSFAGTWTGDEFIDKVVILRAGRGFIIYKNGATMNISVEVKNNKIIARQTSKANASFFPELPREFALTAAPQTEPLEWVMEAVTENILIGEKKTIEAVFDNGNPVSIKKITVTAKWTR